MNVYSYRWFGSIRERIQHELSAKAPDGVLEQWGSVGRDDGAAVFGVEYFFALCKSVFL